MEDKYYIKKIVKRYFDKGLGKPYNIIKYNVYCIRGIDIFKTSFMLLFMFVVSFIITLGLEGIIRFYAFIMIFSISSGIIVAPELPQSARDDYLDTFDTRQKAMNYIKYLKGDLK